MLFYAFYSHKKHLRGGKSLILRFVLFVLFMLFMLFMLFVFFMPFVVFRLFVLFIVFTFFVLFVVFVLFIVFVLFVLFVRVKSSCKKIIKRLKIALIPSFTIHSDKQTFDVNTKILDLTIHFLKDSF